MYAEHKACTKSAEWKAGSRLMMVKFKAQASRHEATRNGKAGRIQAILIAGKDTPIIKH